MDKELEEAQSLTKDDLVRKMRAGRPAKLARHGAPRDPNQRAKAVMDQVISKSEREPRRGLCVDGQYHEVVVLTRVEPELVRFPGSTRTTATRSTR